MSYNNTTDHYINTSQTNYTTPILIISLTVVGMIIIAVITYIMKIKLKKKTNAEKYRMKTIFKKSYVDHKKDEHSSFSLKISNIASEIDVSNSVIGKPSRQNSSTNAIKVINFKALNLGPMTILKPPEETQNNIASSANDSQCKHKKHYNFVSGKITAASTTLINIGPKKTQAV